MTMLSEFERLRLAEALCRSDFVSFIYQVFRTLTPASTLQINYHIWSLAYHLELVRLGIIKRLIINLPPRSLKSMVTSVAFPAFVLGHDPGMRVIVVSYGTDLAIKLNNDFRAVINEPWFQLLFPMFRISRMKNTEFEVTTTRNGYRLASSIDGSLTGRGGDILIVDDPLKPAEAFSDTRREAVNNWYYNTLISRLDDLHAGAVIVVMQRLHDDDLTGSLLRSSEKWVQLKLSAIAEEQQRVPIGPNKYHIRHVGEVLHPERAPRAVLESLRSLDPDTFAAHFQQTPIPPDGIIVKRKWVCYCDEFPVRTSSSLVIQSWDTASQASDSNDWSVCTTWLIQDNKYYLMDVLRERFEFPTLRKRAIAHARAYNPNKILVEDDLLGRALGGELKDAGLLAIAVKPEANKKTRMKIQSAKFESGLVFFPKQAPWLPDYEAELFAFPNVRFDDQVDSTSQALALDHSAFDVNAFADGMGRLYSGLVFGQLFRGRVV
jgi:predicted phage terminase large subunit-like protein